MNEALKSLGIDLSGLIAQGVNFGILLIVLWKFAYKPVLKMLDDRAAKITENVKNGEKIEKELAETEKTKTSLLKKAQIESDQIVNDARTKAKGIEKDATAEASAKAAKIIEDAEITAKKEKEQILDDVKNDIAKLVEGSLNSLLKNDSQKYDDALINEALAGFVEKE